MVNLYCIFSFLILLTVLFYIFKVHKNNTSEQFVDVYDNKDYHLLNKYLHSGCRCSPGYYKNSDDVCTPCPEYKYKSNIDNLTCSTCSGLNRPNQNKTDCSYHDPTNSIMDDNGNISCPLGSIQSNFFIDDTSDLGENEFLQMCICSNANAKIIDFSEKDIGLKCGYEPGMSYHGKCPPLHKQETNIEYEIQDYCVKCDKFQENNFMADKCVCDHSSVFDPLTGECVNGAYLYDILHDHSTLFNDGLKIPFNLPIKSIDMRYLKTKGFDTINLYTSREKDTPNNDVEMSDYGDLRITNYHYSNNNYNKNTKTFSLKSNNLLYPKYDSTDTSYSYNPFKVDFEIPEAEILKLAIDNDVVDASSKNNPICRNINSVKICGDISLTDDIFDKCGCIEYEYDIGSNGYAYMKNTKVKNFEVSTSIGSNNCIVDTTTRKILTNAYETGIRESGVDTCYDGTQKSVLSDEDYYKKCKANTTNTFRRIDKHPKDYNFARYKYLNEGVSGSNYSFRTKKYDNGEPYSYDIRTLSDMNSDLENTVQGLKSTSYNKYDIFRYFDMISAKGPFEGLNFRNDIIENNFIFYVTYPNGTLVTNPNDVGFTNSLWDIDNAFTDPSNTPDYAFTDPSNKPDFPSNTDYLGFTYMNYVDCETDRIKWINGENTNDRENFCKYVNVNKKKLRVTIDLVYGQSNLYKSTSSPAEILGVNSDNAKTRMYNSVFGVKDLIGPSNLKPPWEIQPDGSSNSICPGNHEYSVNWVTWRRNLQQVAPRFSFNLTDGLKNGCDPDPETLLQNATVLKSSGTQIEFTELECYLKSAPFRRDYYKNIFDPKLYGSSIHRIGNVIPYEEDYSDLYCSTYYTQDDKDEIIIEPWPASYNRASAVRQDKDDGTPHNLSHDDGNGQKCFIKKTDIDMFYSDNNVIIEGFIPSFNFANRLINMNNNPVLDAYASARATASASASTRIPQPFFQLQCTYGNNSSNSESYWNNILTGNLDVDAVRVMFIQNIYTSDRNCGVLIAYLPPLTTKKTFVKSDNTTHTVNDLRDFLASEVKLRGVDDEEVDLYYNPNNPNYNTERERYDNYSDILETIESMIKLWNSKSIEISNDEPEKRNPYHTDTNIDDILDNLYILGRYSKKNNYTETNVYYRRVSDRRYVDRNGDYYNQIGVIRNKHPSTETNWFKINLRRSIDDDDSETKQYIIEHPLQQRQIMDPYMSSHTIDRMIEDKYLEYPFVPLFLRMEKTSYDEKKNIN